MKGIGDLEWNKYNFMALFKYKSYSWQSIILALHKDRNRKQLRCPKETQSAYQHL